MEWITNLINRMMGVNDGDFSFLGEGIMKTLGSALVGLVVLITAYFAAKLASRIVSGAICRSVDETLGKFLGRLSFHSVMVVASLGILANFGVPVAAAMAVLTAAGFAIGLAFQGTLSNFAAGVLLLVFRPFKVGDMVSAGGVIGKVNEIDLFTTTFDTPDNRRMIVPNSSIASGTIENVTFHAHRRVDVEVGVAYAANLDETRFALTEAAQSLSDIMIASESRGFQIVLTKLGTSSVDWTVRFWAATENYLVAKERLTREIKMQLDRVGIEIPFPQMQLHVSPNAISPNLSAGMSGVKSGVMTNAPKSQVEPAVAYTMDGSGETSNLPVRPRMRRPGSEAA